jgi:sulfur carrier protein
MEIVLNGKPHAIESAQSIRALVESLDVKPEQVAVALNGEVVTRRLWPETTVAAGDTIEIVRAVGGGAHALP